MRGRGRVDNNQAEIVQALRDAGYSVEVLSGVGKGVPDLLVGGLWRGEVGFKDYRTWLFELKDEKTGKLTEDQIKWHAEWRGGPVRIVTSIAEALAIVGIGTGPHIARGRGGSPTTTNYRENE